MEKLSFYSLAVLAASSAIFTAFAQITDAWYICGVSIVPLFIILTRSPPKRAVKAATVFMLTYHGIMCSFLMTLYDYIPAPKAVAIILCALATAALTALQSAVMMIAVLPAIMLKARPFLKSTVLSACFVLGQFLLEIMPVLAFPWARLENSLAYQPLLLQTSALLGGNFTAFIILMFNAAAAFLLSALRRERVAAALGWTAFASLIFSSNLSFGALYISGKESGTPVTAAAVQGDAEGISKDLLTPSRSALEYGEQLAELPPQVDFALLPETALSDTISDELSSALTEKASADTSVIVGCIYSDGSNRYNCLCALDGGKKHLKNILVPFGEYTPFAGSGGLTPAKSNDCITVKGKKCASLICIESIFSTLLSHQIDSGGELILIPTNDSWFKNSFAREIHFRHSIIRTVEYDRFAVRSGNCGISAIIDRSGFVRASDYSKEKGTVVARAELLNTMTPYARAGNAFVLPPMAFAFWFYVKRALELLLKKITDFRKNSTSAYKPPSHG